MRGVSPTASSSYILYVTDTNGCINSDTVQIILDGTLYVPNTFTPNSDGINDFFEIKGEEINTFEIWIFNRWGELIYNTKNMSNYWDGTYKNSLVQIDTYVWKSSFHALVHLLYIPSCDGDHALCEQSNVCIETSSHSWYPL